MFNQTDKTTHFIPPPSSSTRVVYDSASSFITIKEESALAKNAISTVTKEKCQY